MDILHQTNFIGGLVEPYILKRIILSAFECNAIIILKHKNAYKALNRKF